MKKVGIFEYKELLEALGEPFVFVNPKGVILYANPTAKETFSALDTEKERFLSYLKELKEPFSRIIKERRAIKGYPIRATDSKGHRYFLVNMYPVEKEGTVEGVELIFRDITRHRELEEKEKFTHSLSLIEEVLGRAFHQLSGPLTGLKGAAQLLEEGEDTFECARFIKDEILRLQQLIEEALDFSRPLALEITETNIHRVLEEVLNSFKHEAQAQKVKIERIYDPSIPPILADPFRLYQVFSNLVKNALEAMPNGGILRIKTGVSLEKKITPDSETLLVRIEDTGEGIPPEIEKRLFSPFVTSKSKGTGLGLSIAYKIIKAHEGHLTYFREENLSVFEVSLPLRVNL